MALHPRRRRWSCLRCQWQSFRGPDLVQQPLRRFSQVGVKGQEGPEILLAVLMPGWWRNDKPALGTNVDSGDRFLRIADGKMRGIAEIDMLAATAGTRPPGFGIAAEFIIRNPMVPRR